jgi:hypothetical protein
MTDGLRAFLRRAPAGLDHLVGHFRRCWIKVQFLKYLVDSVPRLSCLKKGIIVDGWPMV